MAKVAALAPALATGGSAAVVPALAGLAISGLGGYLQHREREGAIDDRNQAFQQLEAEEQVRQEQLRAQSQAALDRLVQQHSADTRQIAIEEAVAERDAAIQPEQDVPILPALPGQDRAGEIVQTDAAKTMSEAAKEARKRLSALAGLSGLDAVTQDLGNARATEGTNMGVLANLRRAGMSSMTDAQRMHQLELENFQPSPLGAILSGTGQAVSFGAGLGAFSPATAATTAAARVPGAAGSTPFIGGI